nr:hypothetical protein [Tanacetum cinerariifolium]
MVALQKKNAQRSGGKGKRKENESEHTKDSQLNSDEEEKKDNDGDVVDDEDDDDDHISDIQDTDDEDAKTEYEDDEIYKYKIQVHKDIDVYMVGDEIVKCENKENDEMTDAAKVVIEKTTEEKGDAELVRNSMTFDYQVKLSTELPLPSSSLSVSSRFGTYFLNLYSHVSLTGVLKDSIEVEISLLIDIHIQKETSYIQSSSVLKVPASEILKTTTLLPISEITTETLVSIALSPPHVTPTISNVQQTTTPIPKPPTTTEPPTITTDIPESVGEQAEKQKMPKYTIKSTDKAALRNKGVADTVKNHKRHHDDDKDDIKDPSAGPNQGKKTKKRRTKELESSMKLSTSKETSKGKALSKSFKTGKSATIKELVEEPIADVVNDVDRAQDDVAPNTNKPSRDTWFKQPPRPPTPDLEWNKWGVCWAAAAACSGCLFCKAAEKQSTGGCLFEAAKRQRVRRECFKALTDKLDWNNLEGDRYPFDLTKPLPLKGRSSHLTVAAEYFFNNDLEFLESSDPKKKYTTFITKTKAARYEIVGIKDMVPTLWCPTKVGYDKDALKGIKH